MEIKLGPPDHPSFGFWLCRAICPCTRGHLHIFGWTKGTRHHDVCNQCLPAPGLPCLPADARFFGSKQWLCLLFRSKDHFKASRCIPPCSPLFPTMRWMRWLCSELPWGSVEPRGFCSCVGMELLGTEHGWNRDRESWFGAFFFPSHAQEFMVVLHITWKCCCFNVFSLEFLFWKKKTLNSQLI